MTNVDAAEGGAVRFRLGASTSSSTAVGRSLTERAESVAYAAMAYWFYRWDWGETIALDGLMAVGEDITRGAGKAFATAAAEGWVCSAEPDSIDPMGPASVVMDLVEQQELSATSRALDAVGALARRVDAAGKHMLGLSVHEQDTVLFVDALYGVPSALIRFGTHTGSAEVVDRVGELAVQHCRALQAPDGLFTHFAEASGSRSRSEVPWGRGNGWAVLGISDVLGALPREAAAHAELQEILAKAVERLTELQTPGGEFRNIVDQQESYPESSTTAMIAAGVGQAVAMGHLDGRYADLAERAWAAIEHRIDTNGHVVGVSYRPGVNSDLRRYEHAPALGSYPWGQGAYLRAAALRMADYRTGGANDGT